MTDTDDPRAGIPLKPEWPRWAEVLFLLLFFGAIAFVAIRAATT